MRANTVEHARKSPGHCGRCGVEIKVGDPYRWAKGRYGPKLVRCMADPFRASELTGSDKLSRLYGMQEDISDTLAGAFTYDDVKVALESAAEEAESVAEEYRESASNIEDGFGHSTFLSDELNENGDACDDWANALRGALDDIPETFEEWITQGPDVDTLDAEATYMEQIRDAAESASSELSL